jgi:hypothetical protein
VYGKIRKFQVPSTKLQTSTNDPMTKTKKSNDSQRLCLGHWNLELGIYLEFGICDLEFHYFFTVDRQPSTVHRFHISSIN